MNFIEDMASATIASSTKPTTKKEGQNAEDFPLIVSFPQGIHKIRI